jgi:phosphoglycerol transferase MdoB-like AlkP superfamily enzyme
MNFSIKNSLKKIPIPIQVIILMYLIGMGIFSFYRSLLLLSNLDKTAEYSFGVVRDTLLIGMRFDTTISCYILALPMVLLMINFYLFKNNSKVNKTVFTFSFLVYAVTFLVATIDLPFFNYFYDRLSTSALLWGENTNFSFSIFFLHWPYLWAILTYFFSLFALYYFFKKVYKKYANKSQPKNYSHVFYVFGFLAIFFFSLRGKLDFNVPPLDVRDAYHSPFSFPNKVTLNPVFSFLRSYLNSLLPENANIHFLANEVAIKNAQQFLGISESKYTNPIARDVVGNDSLSKDYNVVVVIMESMTTHKMGRFGNSYNLTPNLDRFAAEGVSFDNFYSGGIHTYNGIFSTLYSQPSIYRKKQVNTSPIDEYYGMPQVLKNKGYQTAFFTTHNELFDNVGGFLRANGVDRVYSDKDYPKEKLIGTWGVADDYLFEYSMEKLNEMDKKGKPFLSVYMTCSDHSPFTLPTYYKTEQVNITEQIVEYADWSIGQFIESCSKESWFKKTLFVFVADHGQSMNLVYDMPLSLNHIPCIIYNPSIVQPKVMNSVGMQIDIFPTIMGVLNQSYTNATMGVDLLKEKRPFAYFNGDDKIGVVDDSLFYIFRDTELETMHAYQEKSVDDVLDNNKELAAEMKTYATSFLQAYQWILEQNLEGEPTPKTK